MRVTRLPDSFVFNTNKFLESTGAGEAKLHIGPSSNKTEFRAFFEAFPCQCTFVKQNLRDYLFSVRFEYEHQLLNRYKDVSLERWENHLDHIESLSGSDLRFSLTEFVDSSRYYVRSISSSHHDVFYGFLRKLALPHLTDIIFEWSSDPSGEEILVTRLELNHDLVAASSVEADSLYEPEDEEHVARQVVYFGPPGTGKSLAVQRVTGAAVSPNDVIRTAFHPDTEYATFVGSYRPVVIGDAADAEISYGFVPGPFTDAYVRAHTTEDPVFLVIEEINRARAAAVIGDLLPLFDRLPSGESEYHVNAEPAHEEYLRTKGLDEAAERLFFPPNLRILATLNTSDQSLFPMDSAFRRRWSWVFCPVNHADAQHISIHVNGRKYSWADFIRVVNQAILETTGSEDKQLGNRFVSGHDNTITEEVFVSKVLAFLWHDVFRHEDPKSQNYLFSAMVDGVATPFTYSQLFGDMERRHRLLTGLFERLELEPRELEYAEVPAATAQVAEGRESASD